MEEAKSSQQVRSLASVCIVARLAVCGVPRSHAGRASPHKDGTDGFNVLCAGGASRFKEGDEASSSKDHILLQPVRCECLRTHERLRTIILQSHES